MDREQELMSTAGLQSLGGGAGLGRGGLDRQLRIVPSMHSSRLLCNSHLVVLYCCALLWRLQSIVPSMHASISCCARVTLLCSTVVRYCGDCKSLSPLCMPLSCCARVTLLCSTVVRYCGDCRALSPVCTPLGCCARVNFTIYCCALLW